MKIALAIVTNRLVQPKTVLSVANLIATSKHEIVTIVATEGYTTAENRNYCVIQAQKNGCSHILFVDDDMIFPEDTLDALLSTEKSIVGVNSHSRTLPLTTTVARMDEKGNLLTHDMISPTEPFPEELFECFSVGMGVALIDMKVFDVIDKPWFKFEVHESGKILIGEDAWFCMQAKKKGISTWCEPNIDIGHIGNYIY